MLCNECYRISIILAFLFGQAKTIKIRYVWTCIFSKRIKKFSVFKNFCILVDEALVPYGLKFSFIV